MPVALMPMHSHYPAGLLAGQIFAVLIVAHAASHTDHLQGYFASEPAIRWASTPVAMGLAVFCNEGMCVMTPSVDLPDPHVQQER